jgi:hypothetical protein
MLHFSKYLVICLSFILSGCISQIASFEDHIKGWIGRPISEYIKVSEIGNVDRSSYPGTKRVSVLENGYKQYEFPYRLCPVYFIVNSKGIIETIKTDNNKECY